jgi:hypothetical protein
VTNIDERFHDFAAREGHDGLAKRMSDELVQKRTTPMTPQEIEIIKAIEAQLDEFDARLAKGADDGIAEVETAIEALTNKLEQAEADRHAAETSKSFEQCVEEMRKAEPGLNSLLLLAKCRKAFPEAFAAWQADGVAKAKAAQDAEDQDDDDDDDDEGEEDVATKLAPRDPKEEPDDDSDPGARDPGRGFLEAVEQIMTARGVSRTAAMTLARKEEPTLFQQYQRDSSTSRLHTTKSTDSQLGRAFVEHLRDFQRQNPKMKNTAAMQATRLRYPAAFKAYREGA